MFKSHRRRLAEVSSIRSHYHVAQLTEEDEVGGPQALIVSFLGAFRAREARADAVFMKGTVEIALSAWPSDALVLDFRALDYEGGDDIGEVLSAGWPYFTPRLIVTSSRSHDALAAYITEEMLDSPARWLRDSLEQALADCRSVVLKRGRASAAAPLPLGLLEPEEGEDPHDWLLRWAECHPARDVRSKAALLRNLLARPSNRSRGEF